MRPRIWWRCGLVAALLGILLGCGLPLFNRSRLNGEQAHGQLSAENRYAGEVLAYMMRVVLGRAGATERQEEWRRRGLGQPLDLQWIAATMERSQRSKSDLMVVDPGLIGLSEVLYDYNPRLNLFKGRYSFHSPYPSAELIALRLLLLGRLARGEALDLSAIVRGEADLLAQGGQLPAQRLSAMGLARDEAVLIQAVFRGEPAFRWYYKCPPLVAAMEAMDLLVPDAFVARQAGAHDYAAWRRAAAGGAPAKVRVAVLPSLVPGFRADDNGRMTPPGDYVRAAEDLKAAIEEAVVPRLAGGSLAEALEIQLFLERPFVIHPLNADHHLARLCPEADLVLIVLGRNVYRSMAIAPPSPEGTAPQCWYLDLLDLKYGQSGSEIASVADAVVHRLANLPPAS